MKEEERCEGVHVTSENTSCAQHIPRILMVEDDDAVRFLNTGFLRHSGFDVDEAEDGAIAWDNINARRYDLVITDNLMPRVTGLELLEMLRTAGISVPVIMATGSVPRSAAPKPGWFTSVQLLMKPYGPSDLLKLVREILILDTCGAIAERT